MLFVNLLNDGHSQNAFSEHNEEQNGRKLFTGGNATKVVTAYE